MVRSLLHRTGQRIYTGLAVARLLHLLVPMYQPIIGSAYCDSITNKEIMPKADLKTSTTNSPSSHAETIVGTIATIGEGEFLVDFEDNSENDPIAARTTVDMTGAVVGDEVVLVFIGGNLSKPVIIGRFRTTEQVVHDQTRVLVDGQQVTISADKRIVLECGKSSITLTEDGKVLIRGKYVLSQATGVAQIKGAVLRLN